MSDETEKSALDYHRFPKPGKIEITPTKPLANQRDLALAYTPGVAEPCNAIASESRLAADLTARGNLVAVITNGTAVLGLGDIGPLAAKPVMEGKAVLFKKFAGIDVFDIEINEKDPEKLVDIIASLEPTFGGINLEDIRSPECFLVEGKLRKRLKIPVFHDDQHGTAIIVGAAVLNGLKIVGKDISEVKLVTTGAGAAAIACIKLLIKLGMKKENIIAVDRTGVIYKNRRGELTPHKRMIASNTKLRTLSEVMKGADIFLGVSGPGVVKQEMIRAMADNPLILALSNPIPEILPEEVKAVRPDAVIATGRSDYPNQVNNVLCFPFVFRGALDVGATTINDEMKIAMVYALAELATEETPDTVVAVYGGDELKFGREYLIPKPFDPRLIIKLAPAVAQAAMDSGVATRPIEDMDLYKQHLSHYVFESIILMRPLFEKAKSDPKRLVYAEGEQTKILHSVQSVLDEGLAKPILIGDPEIIANRIKQMGLRLRPDTDIKIINPAEYKDKYNIYLDDISEVNTSIAAKMIQMGEADALICGTGGHYHVHLDHILEKLGIREEVKQAAAVNVLMLKKGVYFICDTAVTIDPTAEQIADNTLLAAEAVKRFGITPRAALLSFTNGDDIDSETSSKMMVAMEIIKKQDPYLEVQGPIRADAALLSRIRRRVLPYSKLVDDANLLIMPNPDSARIAYDMVKILGDGISIGPILVGINHPVHILTHSSTVRRIVNASAIAVVDAQIKAMESQSLLKTALN
ncbi:MAG: NADP-dependent malic enzyme [Proteobacteria bacterium]|nr:NADP-dependent malic enzyme [Pseudomonadota bacterium]